MKPGEYKIKYLKALCDETEIKTDLLQEEYADFMERYEKVRGIKLTDNKGE